MGPSELNQLIYRAPPMGIPFWLDIQLAQLQDPGTIAAQVRFFRVLQFRVSDDPSFKSLQHRHPGQMAALNRQSSTGMMLDFWRGVLSTPPKWILNWQFQYGEW